jgi:hypothetical protein
MLELHAQLRTAWSDYFTGSATPIQRNEYTSRQTYSSTNVYVLNCLFRSISSTEYGGALHCSSSVTFLLVESSSFFSCSTSAQCGGAIYFYNTNSGQCVLYSVCGYDCYSSYSGSHGIFSYTYVKNDALSKNCVNYSSIVRCVTDKSSSNFMLYLYCGMIFCPSINSSMNKCNSRSGIYCWPFIQSNYLTCSLSYSSFADNIATGSTCIRFDSGDSICEIKNCNVLRNTQGSLSSEGTILTYRTLMITDSCILENKADYIFRQESSSYTITLSNCTVDKTSNNGYMTIQNTVTKSFILALNHISTQNCHSEYDEAGHLTPITPPLSLSKKQKLYYSCNQSRISYLASLISIFIFNFIHPYSSCDSLF